MGRFVSIVALVVLLGATAGIALFSIQAREASSEFRSGNSDGLVASAQSSGFDVQRLTARPSSLSHDPAIQPAKTVLLVLAPSQTYGAGDREAVKSFVAAGGTLLVADDVGQSNSLLAAFGLRLERVRLVDGDLAWISTAPHQPTLNTPSPTAIALGANDGAEILARSSPDSYLDRDGDGVIGDGDPVGSFAIATRLRWGLGQVVVLADADALGAAFDQNREWLSNQLGTALSDGGLVLVDESDSIASPLVAATAFLRTAASTGATRWALISVTGLALIGFVTRHAWLPWAAHRFRPMRFVRRALVGTPLVAALPKNQWTARGAMAVAASLALGLLHFLTGSLEAALAAGTGFAAIGIALLTREPRLDAHRIASADRVGEGFPVDVELELRRTFGHGEVEAIDHIPDSFKVVTGTNWFLTIPHRRATTLRYRVEPAVRGAHRIGPLAVRQSDMLGLRLAEGHLTQATPLEVTPRAASLRKLPFTTRRPSVTLGPHRVNRAGDGSEFHALRNYQPGDPFRSVNWKASARSRNLMVNQRVHESMTCVTIFLDARQLAGAGLLSVTPLEQSCRAAIALATEATRARDQVRLVVYGDGVRDLGVRVGGRQIHDITETLARLVPAGSTMLAEAVAGVVPTLPAGTPVLVISGLEGDPGAPGVFRMLRGRGLLPSLISPTPATRPTEAEDGGGEPNEGLLTRERADVLAQVRGLGIPTFEVDGQIPLDDLFREAAA